MKTQTQLRIVKRDGLFVVQIRKQRFWTRRWWWQDMKDHYDCNGGIVVRAYQPLPKTKFNYLNEASIFCDKYLSKERSKNNQDIEVKTYNTGHDDRHWPPPLSYKPPPPPPPPRNVKGTYAPPKSKIPPPLQEPPPKRILNEDVWINKPTKGDDDE